MTNEAEWKTKFQFAANNLTRFVISVWLIRFYKWIDKTWRKK